MRDFYVQFRSFTYATSRYLLWTILILTMFSVRVVFSASFTTFIATIAGSVDKSLIGTANGIAFSALNVARYLLI